LVYKLTSTHEDSQLTAQVMLVVLKILKYAYFGILCFVLCVCFDQTVCGLIRLCVV